jgi:potassium-dependent mechanosensitive channel
LRIPSFRLLAFLSLVLFAFAAHADEASNVVIEKHNKTLDRARATLDEVEKALTRTDASDGELRLLRERVEPLPLELQIVIDHLAPRLQAIDARLQELGSPAPDAKPDVSAPAPPAPAPAPAPPAVKPAPAQPPAKAAPVKPDAKASSAASQGATPPVEKQVDPAAASSVTAVVNAEWTEQRKLYDDIDATLKRARSLQIEARQMLVAIIARQRALFAKTLFLRSRSLFAPTLWKEALADAPRMSAAAAVFFEERATNFANRVNGAHKAELLGVVVLILLSVPLLMAFARRVATRAQGIAAPAKLKKAVAAAWAALATSAAPLAAMMALASALESFDVADAMLGPVLTRLFEGVGRVAVAFGVARAVLAPAAPRWRLVDPGDPLAGQLTRLAVAVVATMAGVRLLEQIEETAQAALSIAILTRGLGALLCAALVVATLRRFPRGRVGDANAGRDWLSLTRLLGFAAAATVVVACALGYVTFANFFIVQSCWTLVVAGVLLIVLTLLRAAIDRFLAPTGRFGLVASTVLGVERQSLRPLAALLSGALTLTCFGIAALLVLAPFGVESGDFLTDLQSSFLAVKIADVTISPSTAFVALALFAITLAAAHGLRRWLDGTLLPLTRLDMGLRNSIGASVGYAGFILAVSVAMAHLGIGFEKLAIVAGALSVGIGFGLQSIVNNFVSGLILLWERAIRVGDWVVLGDEQGYVKRINVRSTEIETFDRATMIVPNSNLVTGVVKNWLRGDKVGRIKIPLAPHSGVDPEQIRDILLAAARAQDGVLRIPAPQVMFLGMEAAQFRFELWCYLEDVEQSTRVRSDLHFDLYKRLGDAGIKIAAPPPPTPATVVQFEGFEKFAVEQRLLEADEVAKQGVKLARKIGI